MPYIERKPLIAAWSEGPEAVVDHLERLLIQAIADKNVDGIFDVVDHLFGPCMLCDQSVRTKELAWQFAELTGGSVQSLRSIAEHAYTDLGETALALRYLEKAEASLRGRLQEDGLTGLGHATYYAQAIIRLELFILTEADIERKRVRRVLSELTFITVGSGYHDDYLWRALPVLVSRGVAKSFDLNLVEKERANVKARGATVSSSRRELTTLTKVINRLRMDIPQADTTKTAPAKDQAKETGG